MFVSPAIAENPNDEDAFVALYRAIPRFERVQGVDSECLISQYADSFEQFIKRYPTSPRVRQAAEVVATQYRHASEIFQQLAADPARSAELTGSDRYMQQSKDTLRSRAQKAAASAGV